MSSQLGPSLFNIHPDIQIEMVERFLTNPEVVKVVKVEGSKEHFTEC
mgnify:CR=1